jgi:hypothetical protein
MSGRVPNIAYINDPTAFRSRHGLAIGHPKPLNDILDVFLLRNTDGPLRTVTRHLETEAILDLSQILHVERLIHFGLHGLDHLDATPEDYQVVDIHSYDK